MSISRAAWSALTPGRNSLDDTSNMKAGNVNCGLGGGAGGSLDRRPAAGGTVGPAGKVSEVKC